MIAKQIIKGKFWVVEEDGKQIATIQASPSGVSYVQDNKRESFVSISLLKSKHNIAFSNAKKPKPAITFEVNGYPCDHRPHNSLLEVVKKIPVFTKTDSSKSFYCAGHYLVKYSSEYVSAYCPKLLTLKRNEFIGPFKTNREAREYLKEHKR